MERNVLQPLPQIDPLSKKKNTKLSRTTTTTTKPAHVHIIIQTKERMTMNKFKIERSEISS